jgi:hypothetical protein
MLSLARTVCALAFAGSAFTFALAAYVFADWNAIPVALPVPLDGHVVATPFMLATSGQFEVRVTTPTGGGADDGLVLGSVPRCLEVTVDSGAAGERRIRTGPFTSDGQNSYGRLRYFRSLEHLPVPRGPHTAVLRSCSQMDGQAYVELVRSGDQTGPAVLAFLVRGLAWVLAAIGGLAGLVWLCRRTWAGRGP